jgi:hypothetical protein
MSNTTLENYANTHRELALALGKWDRRYGKEID